MQIFLALFSARSNSLPRLKQIPETAFWARELGCGAAPLLVQSSFHGLGVAMKRQLRVSLLWPYAAGAILRPCRGEPQEGLKRRTEGLNSRTIGKQVVSVGAGGSSTAELLEN